MGTNEVPDFTDRFNTPLSPQERVKYLAWVKTLPKEQQNTFDYDLQGAFLAGAGRAANGHLPDTFKKPNHPTFSTQSKYSGVDGFHGGIWQPEGHGKWIYTPSLTNLKFRTPQQLQEYFTRVEPDSILHFVTPTPRPNYVMQQSKLNSEMVKKARGVTPKL